MQYIQSFINFCQRFSDKDYDAKVTNWDCVKHIKRTTSRLLVVCHDNDDGDKGNDDGDDDDDVNDDDGDDDKDDDDGNDDKDDGNDNDDDVNDDCLRLLRAHPPTTISPF